MPTMEGIGNSKGVGWGGGGGEGQRQGGVVVSVCMFPDGQFVSRIGSIKRKSSLFESFVIDEENVTISKTQEYLGLN